MTKLPTAGSSLLKSGSEVANSKIVADVQSLQPLQAHFSNTRQKRFIFVDHSGGKSRIYFHPSMVKDLSDITLAKDMSYLSALSGENVSSGLHPMMQVVSLKDLCQGDSAGNELALLAYERTMASAFAALHEMRSNRESLVLFEGMRSNPHPLVPMVNAEAQCTTQLNWEVENCANPDVSSASRLNDTDDLEALLNSDDETSTGESPGDYTWTSESESLIHKYDEISAPGQNQRSEFCFKDRDGHFTVKCFEAKESDCHCSVNEQLGVSNLCLLASDNSQISQKAVAPNSFQQSKSLGGVPSSSSQFSSSSTAKKRKHYSVHSLPVRSGSVKESRKDQSKQAVRLLQSIIPGVGGHTDTAAVLNKAIWHIRSLQRKVQDLEKARQQSEWADTK
ncbi:hypothetical protein O6H91_05G019800 [Diphasiastrum complanatum]|nr:hypothetical protein O6H91_05G019800 [Diphasiastrum complanatum]